MSGAVVALTRSANTVLTVAAYAVVSIVIAPVFAVPILAVTAVI